MSKDAQSSSSKNDEPSPPEDGASQEALADKKPARKRSAKKTAAKKQAKVKDNSEASGSEKEVSPGEPVVKEIEGEAPGVVRISKKPARKSVKKTESEKDIQVSLSKENEDDSDGQDGEDGAKPEKAQVEEKREPEVEPPEVPETADLTKLRALSIAELYSLAEKLPIRIPAPVEKSSLIVAILSCYLKYGTKVVAEGLLERVKENFAMLRDPSRSFKASADDIYVHVSLIEDQDLRQGQEIKVLLGEPRGRDNFLPAREILEIDGIEVSKREKMPEFDSLTSLFPEERFLLDGAKGGVLATRLLDLISPIGMGQRGLIVAPPRGGKTILLKQIAEAIEKNHPKAELVVLLLDERPEEVTDFEETVKARVFASTFDEPAKRHAQVANLVLDYARRRVEAGKDVIILLDSLTRLARGFNGAMTGGPIGSGGVNPKAIAETRKFFGAARNVEEGGSLTILATCLIETENRMDDVIFEELKGTGNMEVRLDRILAEQRIYPAIHIPQSGTRNDDRLYHPDEFSKIVQIRKELAGMPVGEALEVLLNRLSKTSTNPELLLKGLR